MDTRHRNRLRILPLSVLLILILACNISGRTPAQTGQDGPIKSKTFTISPAGASVELGDFKATISKTNLQSPIDIVLEEYKSPALEDPNVTAQSNTFHLANLPPDFSGEIQITLTIPSEVMNSLDPNDPERAKKITLFLGEPGYSRTDGGVSIASVPFFDAQVDLDAGEINAVINLSRPTAFIGSNKTAALKRAPAYDEWWETTPHHLYFKVVAGVFWNSTTADPFTVYFPKGTSAGPVLDALLESHRALEGLGFTISRPVAIYVDVPGSDLFGSEHLGLFSWTLMSGYQIEIHPKLLTSGNEKALKATIGHELMHFAQLLAYEHTSNLDSYASTDEATAIWFETYLFGDPDYFAPLADEHIWTFLTQPWFSGDAKSMSRAGYGASWYVHYLVNQYGAEFIAATYHSDEQSGQSSWVHGLDSAEGIDQDLTYRQFLAAFIIQPTQVSPAIYQAQTYNDVFERIVILEHLDPDRVVFTPWEKLASDLGENFQASEGLVIGDTSEQYLFSPQPQFDIKRTLDLWNAYYVFLKVNKNLATYSPVDVIVSVNSNRDWSGVMVFGIPNGGIVNDAVPIYGPENFLSSGDFSISDIGPKGTNATYSELIFVLFNSGFREANVSLNVAIQEKRAVLLSGIAIGERWAYPENVCDISCCWPPPPPPPCYVDPGGGGGGGGDGDSACDKPCPVIPEWCYGCSPNNICLSVLSAGRYDTDVFITVDNKGTISEIRAPLWGNQGAPEILQDPSSPGSFSATWYNESAKISIEMHGTVSPTGGEGWWAISCPIGQMVYGTWSVSPER